MIVGVEPVQAPLLAQPPVEIVWSDKAAKDAAHDNDTAGLDVDREVVAEVAVLSTGGYGGVSKEDCLWMERPELLDGLRGRRSANDVRVGAEAGPEVRGDFLDHVFVIERDSEDRRVHRRRCHSGKVGVCN